MNKKGFTLIELLAIIFLLAAISIIIFPNIISNFEKKEDEIDKATLEILYSSTEEYMRKYSDLYSNGAGVTYCIKISTLYNEDLVPIDVSKYLNKSIQVRMGKKTSYQLNDCDSGPTKIKPSSTETHKGIVYLDPTNLFNLCDESNSSIGSGTSGCMKWYIYAETKDEYKMILDHNIIAKVAYNTSGTYAEYDSASIKTQVNTSTEGWSGNPRLITADEITEITNTTTFDGSSNTAFYLDGTGENKQTKVSTTQGSSPYAWLYDYTDGCATSGCNIADPSTSGYWTNTAVSDNANRAWVLSKHGYLGISDTNSESDYGVRPVITVSKALFN